MTVDTEPLRLSAARTCSEFDNLVPMMREMFYRLAAGWPPPRELAAGREVLCAYEGLTIAGVADPAVTLFKGLPVRFDPSVPDLELHFRNGDLLLGVLWHVT